MSVAATELGSTPQPAEAGPAQAARSYDAFISYSHALDKPIAATLQSAIQRLGKAWHQRRALRLFRDDTSLTATPHLWPSIEQALGKARYLILLASHEAATSPWVGKEVEWWLDHRGADTVLIALTAGDLSWDGAAGDFRWSEATPLPPMLRGRFADEPRWIDLRSYRENASSRDARLAELAADFAATLHGRAKEDLLSQEVRQQRRTLRLAGAAVALLVMLLGLAGWQWRVAVSAKQAALAAEQRALDQQRLAESQRNRAEHTLALATETANGLVFNLAQRFRASGVPISVIADILAQARHLQDQLTAGGEISPDLQRSEEVALGETSTTLLSTGDTKAALDAATRGLDIAKSLLAGSTGNTGYQRDLIVADSKLGEALIVEGDMSGALAAYRDGLAIGRILVRQEPGNAVWRRDVSISDNRIGQTLYLQGDYAGALAALRDSLAIRKALAQENPSDAARQKDVSVEDEEIGDALREQGDYAGALAAYGDNLAIVQTLVQLDSRNTDWQYDLSVSDEKIGELHELRQDFVTALASYKASLAIRQMLADKDPENRDWQFALAGSYGRLGTLLANQGDRTHPLSLYRAAEPILEALVQKDPANLSWQHDLGTTESRIGTILLGEGDRAGALVQYRASLTIAKALAARAPSNAEWQFDLALALGAVAAAGDNPRANAGEAIAILNQLATTGQLSAAKRAAIPQIEALFAKFAG